MDGITLACVANELQSFVGARIEKIHQPLRDEITLSFKNNTKLLISANASAARIQITKTPKQNPDVPPMFCTLLRKNIGNGKITSVLQPGFDRVLHINIVAQNELKDLQEFTLIVEIMGKHSNIILIKKGEEKNNIIDAIKHITPAISSYRNLMPGLSYVCAPPQNKHDPNKMTQESIYKIIENSSASFAKEIINSFSGISPLASQEIAARVCAALKKISSQNEELFSFCSLSVDQKQVCAKTIYDFFAIIRNKTFAITLIKNDLGEPINLFPYDPMTYLDKFKQRYDSIFEALDDYNALKDQTNLLKQRGNNLQKLLQNNIERCAKKLVVQNDILQSIEKIEEFRLLGELLTANAHSLERGEFAVVQNYYDPDLKTIKIPLDNKISVSQNAQKYYKKYNKSKLAFDMATDQIKKISLELDYLEGQLDNLSKCTVEKELDEIRSELFQMGYIKKDFEKAGLKKSLKTKKTSVSLPMRFVSSSGIDIYVGKNNAQNDYLTLRFASPQDLWLHTKNIPGSHVIIKSENPDDITLSEAAQLAVWFSKARSSQKVAVDYTPKKYIKKPNASAPGFVIYSTNKTLYITADPLVVNSLKQLS